MYTIWIPSALSIHLVYTANRFSEGEGYPRGIRESTRLPFTLIVIMIEFNKKKKERKLSLIIRSYLFVQMRCDVTYVYIDE